LTVASGLCDRDNVTVVFSFCACDNVTAVLALCLRIWQLLQASVTAMWQLFYSSEPVKMWKLF